MFKNLELHKEVDALSRAFSEYGFETHKLEDPESSKEIYRFVKAKIQAAKKENFLLITYIGGHGLEHDGSHKLVLNVINNKTNFNEMVDVWETLRDLPQLFSKLYQIIVVATCRHKTSDLKGFTTRN